ncbi:hypothetical protein [Qipengyuania sediminis]|uniref:hypothetical protein n=1 Tax=Qipengyuania sediminis TaxID=1532023 RepID=UPI001404B836|nr:hypothetical protein [Qipengyuania sediminis]
MKPARPLLLAAALVFALPMTGGAAANQPKGDQGAARKEAQAGHILKSREIEARILPMMQGAEYLGFAYDSTAMAYRLKFIRDRRVLFVDVDARSGRIIQRSW